jgi:uncharacterized membrane protein
VHALHTEAGLPEDAHRAAIDRLTTTAEPGSWRPAMDATFLALGAGLWVAAVIYGVAWNWADIGPLTRLAGMQAVFAVVAGFGAWAGPQRADGNAALVAAIVLIGPLFALVGHTYQTGANAWTLFFWWAVLATPFALASRTSWSWVIWTIVWTTTAALYVASMPSAVDTTGWMVIFLVGLIPGLGAMALRLADPHLPWRQGLAPQRVLLSCTGLAWSGGATFAVLDLNQDQGMPYLLVLSFGLFFALTHIDLLRNRREAFGASVASMGAVVMVVTFLGRHIFEAVHNPDFLVFLVLGLWVVGQSIAHATFIRNHLDLTEVDP